MSSVAGNHRADIGFLKIRSDDIRRSQECESIMVFSVLFY